MMISMPVFIFHLEISFDIFNFEIRVAYGIIHFHSIHISHFKRKINKNTISSIGK